MTAPAGIRLEDLWLSLTNGLHGPVVLRASFGTGAQYRAPIEEPRDAGAVAQALEDLRDAILADAGP